MPGDIVDVATRSRMMSGIRGKNTKPELVVRRELHSMGFRFRLHDRKLPGRPDIILPKWHAAVLVHGCFWHGHDCNLFRWPGTRVAFWRQKIEGNRARDAAAVLSLDAAGWRVLEIWECSLKGPGRLGSGEVAELAAAWIRSGAARGEIRGERRPVPDVDT